MNPFLIKLARFVSEEEQEQIKSEINKFCLSFKTSFQIISDNWRSKNRILLLIESKEEYSKKIIEYLLSNPGVITVIRMFPDSFNFNLPPFKTLIDHLSDKIQLFSINEEYQLDFRGFSNIPFHKKSIIDRLKKKKLRYKEDSESAFYFEVMKDKHTQSLIGRLGVKYTQDFSNFKRNRFFHTSLVIFSPYTVQEVADFFRLALCFQTELIITNENQKADQLLKNMKKTYFKGLSKVKYHIVNEIESLITDPQNICLGFSLWGKQDIIQFLKKLDSIRQQYTSSDSKILLIYGNEERGLPLNLRTIIPVFRIGTLVSEPLRASQAAAYTLGLLDTLKL